MTADDPRVQRARELLQGTIHADHESEEARSVIRDLLDVVDELRTLRMMAHDLQTEATLRAEAAEAERNQWRQICTCHPADDEKADKQK